MILQITVNKDFITEQSQGFNHYLGEYKVYE